MGADFGGGGDTGADDAVTRAATRSLAASMRGGGPSAVASKGALDGGGDVSRRQLGDGGRFATTGMARSAMMLAGEAVVGVSMRAGGTGGGSTTNAVGASGGTAGYDRTLRGGASWRGDAIASRVSVLHEEKAAVSGASWAPVHRPGSAIGSGGAGAGAGASRGAMEAGGGDGGDVSGDYGDDYEDESEGAQ